MERGFSAFQRDHPQWASVVLGVAVAPVLALWVWALAGPVLAIFVPLPFPAPAFDVFDILFGPIRATIGIGWAAAIPTALAQVPWIVVARSYRAPVSTLG